MDLFATVFSFNRLVFPLSYLEQQRSACDLGYIKFSLRGLLIRHCECDRWSEFRVHGSSGALKSSNGVSTFQWQWVRGKNRGPRQNGGKEGRERREQTGGFCRWPVACFINEYKGLPQETTITEGLSLPSSQYMPVRLAVWQVWFWPFLSSFHDRATWAAAQRRLLISAAAGHRAP